MDPKIPEQVTEQATQESSSPLSDADKIRLKRLAKLAKLQQNSSDNLAGTSKNVVSSSSSVSAQSTSSTAATTSQQLQNKGSQEPMNTTSISPKPKRPLKSFEDWQDDVISKVLQITLDKSSAEKSDSQLIYLNSLVAELKEEDPAKTSFKLSQSLLEKALFARLSIDPNQMSDDEETFLAISKLPRTSLFNYLLDCWKRASEIKRNLLTRASKTLDPLVVNERVKVMEALKDLLVNYVGLVIQYPDMFPQVNNSMDSSPQQLVPRLLADINSPEGLPLDFIQELAARVDEEGFEKVFGQALVGLAAQMRSRNILNDYLNPLNGLVTLTEIKSLAAMLPKLRSWNPPDLTAKAFEVASLLGPFCRLSVFPSDEPSISENYFGNIQRSKADVDSLVISLRGAMQGVQKTLFNIFNNIIRSSPSSKEAVLSYFARVIKLNEKRTQMQVDPSQVGTDGFLMNLSSVSLTFAEPIYSKIDRIDIHYFRKSKRIDISQETKIKATQPESDEYYSSVGSEVAPPNFISEIFFITLAMHHYGPLQCYNNYNNFNRDLVELQKQYDRMKAEQPNWAGTPAAAFNEVLLKRCKDQLEKWAVHKIAYDSQLLDPTTLSRSLQFYNLVINWVLRIVDPTGQYPAKQISLPLPPTPPEEFIMLPEFVIEDITEFFSFISRYNPKVILSCSRDELVIFIITFLKSSSYIKNPYLKAKLVEILFYYTMRNENEGGIGMILNTHPIALEHLMSSLMSFYVEVEQTGTHTQFYDKFNIRYNISQIFNSIWNNPIYRDKLKEESRKTDSFVKFANLLMNDATYLLDESLTKLTELRNIQNEMDNTDEWNRKTQQQRQERENLLRSLERQATSYMALGNETVHMLEYMTSEAAEPFLTPQIVDRLAAMLDYNLNSLVGPRCTELKVKNQEKYRFQPRTLLQQLITIYLNLCKSKEFIQAVARDGRSYRKELFSKAANILMKYSLKLDRDVKVLENFVNDVEEVIKKEAAGEEELGEVPDEFLDPLIFEIMEDPVILPGSNISIDRKSITTHLLSDATDPFNRKPLTIDQVIPNTELKERIEAFKREKREKRNG
ncbi:ubiquitin elongating factor core-domain-containing protein [Glomus cerebriforme]|uniref:RING-type E3 ubiquitin transferase n=1 Tax=Glomus cerebriforme TaxID=658196 RepID=A0A397TMR1_9GLOM|nr:ubiquitin elongating factor core-domain-containing protein [Glomus cerebriforme]